jgi:hypothetical protein
VRLTTSPVALHLIALSLLMLVPPGPLSAGQAAAAFDVSVHPVRQSGPCTVITRHGLPEAYCRPPELAVSLGRFDSSRAAAAHNEVRALLQDGLSARASAFERLVAATPVEVSRQEIVAAEHRHVEVVLAW